MQSQFLTIKELQELLKLDFNEIFRRIKILGLYYSNSYIDPQKLKISKENAYFIENFKSFDYAYKNGLNIFAEMVRLQPARYRFITHNFFQSNK